METATVVRATTAREDPGDLIVRLAEACKKSDPDLARAQFAAGVWNRKRDSGEGFYRQATRNGFELINKGAKTEGDWRIGSLDENEDFGPLFLGKKIEASFHAEDLPADRGLDEIGAALLAASKGDEQAKAALAKLLADSKRDEAVKRISDMHTAAYAGSHLAAGLGCGALVFKAAADEHGRAEELFLHVVKRGDPFLAHDGMWPSSSVNTSTARKIPQEGVLNRRAKTCEDVWDVRSRASQAEESRASRSGRES
jgi:hypothetical protein